MSANSSSDSVIQLPSAFKSRMSEWFSDDELVAFFDALDSTSKPSIRFHRSTDLTRPKGDQVPWCSDGFYVSPNYRFVYDPLWHAGAYYVQEASSMAVGEVFRSVLSKDQPVIALDLCAAPGGKSTHLLDALPEGSLLVANEVNRKRVSVLAENLLKWGDERIVVTNNDPADFSSLEGVFDVVLVDAPCSGEGMFRKDKEARNEWSEANVELCAARQKRILADIWPAVKPGGILVYSTCTFNREENEENLAWLANQFDANWQDIDVLSHKEIASGIQSDYPLKRFFPHRTNGEGLVVAVCRKPDDEGMPPLRAPRKSKVIRVPKPVTQTIEQWIEGDVDFIADPAQNIRAFPSGYLTILDVMLNNLRVKEAGIPIAEQSRKGIKPLHGLASSRLRKKDIFSEVPLTESDALRYLQRDALPANGQPNGETVLLTFKGVALGFGKVVGNRINNQYPMNWRIRRRLSDQELQQLEQTL